MRNFTDDLKTGKVILTGLILLAAGLFSFFYWGNQKQVWFCDEIYTYESANGFEQAWPASCLDEWMTGSDVEAFFAADWDRLSLNDITIRLYNDHVPLYFWLFRIVSVYFFHGSGSIWIGLSINLVYYVIILGVGYGLFLYLTKSPMLSGLVTFLTLVSNRLILEQITTLRMYAMLLLAEILLLLAALWILRETDRAKIRPGVFVYLFVVSVFGMLTHYDFWIFYALTASVFCMWFLISAVREKRRFWATLKFKIVLIWLVNFVCSLLTTIFIFPYCRWNLNRGKGQLALKSIFVFSAEKIENIFWGFERLAASMFGEVFPVVIALLMIFGCLAGGGVILYKKKEAKKLTGFVLCVMVAQAYQLAVCFTLPDVREERYLWGSFTVMMLCLAWSVILIFRELILKMKVLRANKRFSCFVSAAFMIGILVGEIIVIDGGYGITYLFHPEKDVAILKEYDKIPWIVYGPTVGVYSYYDWLIPERICFLSQDNTDEDVLAFCKIEEQEEFVLYIYEDLLSGALELFNEASGERFTAQYLTKSTNLSVYLIEKE